MPSKVSSERLRLAKILLQELREQLGWTELEKRLLHQSGTHGKFRILMDWLRRNRYIIKMGASGSRACYRYNPEQVGSPLKERLASRFERAYELCQN